MEEALSAAQDDSSGANPSSVKSDNSTPPPDSGRGSPPPHCAICLGTCKNKSFTDSCLHQFCFSCLLTWSKVKAECPLCKQAFRSIIHNVRSNHQYEEYLVVRQTEESTSRIDIDRLASTHRFRYRTTLTLPRRESIALQQLLRHVFPAPSPRAPPARRRRSPASFRRTVYRHNLWARPLPDFTGRFRDCSPEFYRYNDTQMHRLVPWINRELYYLLNENAGHISYVMARILELLPQYHINSPEFRAAMHRYFGDRTDHFLHELYCFASTPYDMTGYDRNVQYTTDSRISTIVNEVISSSDSEASADSDIVMVSSSAPAETPAGPSRYPAPVYPQGYISQPIPDNSVIPIEHISHSDTDDDSSEVMVVGYIKPPQERTPEVVDLLESDSDVIVQDNPPPEPVRTRTTESQESVSVPSVKVTLKRQRSESRRGSSSSSDECVYRPARRRPRPAAPACSPSPSPSPPTTSTATTSPGTPSPSSSTSPRTTTSTTSSTETDDDDSDYSKSLRKRSKRKSSKGKSRLERKKFKKRSSRSHHKEKKMSHHYSEKDKRSKRKSHSGKGVKSSYKSRNDERSSIAPEQTQLDHDQPSTSGIPSLKQKRKVSKETKRRRRDSRENKRLKSVVNVMYNARKNTYESNSSASCNMALKLDVGTNGNVESTPSTSTSHETTESSYGYSEMSGRHRLPDTTDSEDNLPLNLTLQKMSSSSSS